MDTNLNKVLKEILSTEDGKYISHIPKNFLTKEKIENFLLARQEEKEKKLILKSRPYKVMIEPTNSCNLGCPICPTGLKIKSRDKGIIKLEQFKKFIDQIKNKTIELYLQNWGEPTLSKQLPEMISYASSQGLWMNLSTNFSIKYKNDASTYSVTAVNPDYQFLEKTIVTDGRFLNERDLNQQSKSIVIGRLIKEDLFGERPAIGKRVNVNGSSYLVIGVFSDEGGDNEERMAYIPISTAQMMYGSNDYISQIKLGYDPSLSTDAAIAFGHQMERDLRKKLEIHPDDQSALSVRNMADANKFISTVMFALLLIITFIGSGTLIAGIIGISNIMIFVIVGNYIFINIF